MWMPSIILNNFSTSFIEAVSLNQTQSLSIDLVSLGSPVASIHPPKLGIIGRPPH